MCSALFYYTCVYIYSLLNFCDIFSFTYLLVFILYFNTIVEKSPILTEPGPTFQILLSFVSHL